MFNVLPPQVVFQEVPDEVALSFIVTGCKLGCSGCHSVDIWDEHKGEELSLQRYQGLLHQYTGLITCVVFFGGEWQPHKLLQLLTLARKQGLKTCLYTGLNDVCDSLKNQINYLKTGAYIKQLGGLDSPISNQRFIETKTQTLLNYKFIRE